MKVSQSWFFVQVEAFVGRRYRQDLVDPPLQFVGFLFIHVIRFCS